ncbi:hypothetical protein ABB37_00466 [Leptomonas pyrrhocoris]|uniref:Transmembrane protein n=1 Tax=Leptomonas pyrrhocoris TaxID=157538 RepID=A0A0N0E0B0_LEPPY|nr:hypothetical protein ABB37_00466 [Leptomonas pyrrhocoris]KPA86231.1 hypothetical protein ABB37_00466 [Leptomonas pyrrhocoris]|eukprot:XP_015664670.1 hypothetical protein ABB37_00466 [Leptomonas pyrrhocoris]
MEHHMYEHTISITLYLTYATLTMSLMVCSILSPIRTVTVDGRQLRVYGVAVSFDVPPLGWNKDGRARHDSRSSSGADDSSVSAAASASIVPVDRSTDFCRTSAIAPRSTLPSAKMKEEIVAFLDSDHVGQQGNEMAVPLDGSTAAGSGEHQRCTETQASPHDFSKRINQVPERNAGDTAFASVANVRTHPLLMPFTSPESPSELDPSDSGAGCNSNRRHDNRTKWVSLRKLPSSDLARCMTAYLVFGTLCLLFSFLLIATLFLRLLPMVSDVPLRIALRILTVAGPLCAILCFAMAAALGLQGNLVRHVADGYYTNTSHHAVVNQLHSGFSTTVAAAFVALLVATLSPIMWK